MNKKEKKLIEMFKHSVEVAKRYCDGTIWGFLGALEVELATEAVAGKSIDLERLNKAWELAEELKKITSELK